VESLIGEGAHEKERKDRRFLTKGIIIMRPNFVSDVYMAKAVHETADAPTPKKDPTCIENEGQP